MEENIFSEMNQWKTINSNIETSTARWGSQVTGSLWKALECSYGVSVTLLIWKDTLCRNTWAEVTPPFPRVYICQPELGLGCLSLAVFSHMSFITHLGFAFLSSPPIWKWHSYHHHSDWRDLPKYLDCRFFSPNKSPVHMAGSSPVFRR